jgi:hypothetical protein
MDSIKLNWSKKKLIGQLTLDVFKKRPVRIRMQGVVGAEG